MGNETSEVRNPKPIDLMPLIWKCMKALGRIWFLVVILTALGAAAMVFLTERSYSPIYEATATFTVDSGTEKDDVTTSYSSAFSSAYANNFASSFPYIIRNSVMTEIIREDLGVSYVNGNITAKTTDKTNLVTISVTSNNKNDALAILNSVMENYPQVARYVLGSTRLNILKNPSVSDSPINPLSRRNSAVKGGAAGLVLGLILVFFLALADNPVSGSKDMENDLHLRCLGSVPQLQYNRVRRRGKRVRTAISLEDERTPGMYRESMRSLRTHLLQALDDSKECRVLLVTSTFSGEGKSTTALNLAQSLAHNGSRVILVDADLRKQSIRKMVGRESDLPGLGDLLGGKYSLEHVLFEYGKPAIRILSGKPAPDRVDLLGTKAMSDLIDQMRGMADFVIIDSTPCGILADAMAIAEFADYGLYVVRQDRVQTRRVLYSLEMLGATQLPIVGGVLNGADYRRGHYGYGYGYGGHYGYGSYGHRYGYGYGYGYGEYGEDKKKKKS